MYDLTLIRIHRFKPEAAPRSYNLVGKAKCKLFETLPSLGTVVFGIHHNAHILSAVSVYNQAREILYGVERNSAFTDNGSAVFAVKIEIKILAVRLTGYLQIETHLPDESFEKDRFFPPSSSFNSFLASQAATSAGMELPPP